MSRGVTSLPPVEVLEPVRPDTAEPTNEKAEQPLTVVRWAAALRFGARPITLAVPAALSVSTYKGEFLAAIGSPAIGRPMHAFPARRVRFLRAPFAARGGGGGRRGRHHDAEYSSDETDREYDQQQVTHAGTPLPRARSLPSSERSETVILPGVQRDSYPGAGDRANGPAVAHGDRRWWRRPATDRPVAILPRPRKTYSDQRSSSIAETSSAKSPTMSSPVHRASSASAAQRLISAAERGTDSPCSLAAAIREWSAGRNQ